MLWSFLHKDALMAKLNYDKADLMSNPKLAELLEFHGVVPPTKISATTGSSASSRLRKENQTVFTSGSCSRRRAGCESGRVDR